MECGTAVGRVIDRDGAVMGPDQLPGHTQTQTEVGRVGTAGRATVEAVKDPLHFTVRDSGTVVDAAQAAKAMIADFYLQVNHYFLL